MAVFVDDVPRGVLFSGRALIVLVLAVLAALVFYVSGLLVEQQERLLVEGGFFESASVVGYGLCIGLMFVLWPLKAVVARWYIVGVLALFALRELDYDKVPFTKGLFKSRQYFGGGVDGGEVFFSACVLLCVVGIVVSLFVKEGRGFVRGVLACAPAPLAVFCGLGLAASSKSADGIGRKMADFGVVLDQATLDYAHVFEEIAEAGIPVMFMIAVIYSVSSRYFSRYSNQA